MNALEKYAAKRLLVEKLAGLKRLLRIGRSAHKKGLYDPSYGYEAKSVFKKKGKGGLYDALNRSISKLNRREARGGSSVKTKNVAKAKSSQEIMELEDMVTMIRKDPAKASARMGGMDLGKALKEIKVEMARLRG